MQNVKWNIAGGVTSGGSWNVIGYRVVCDEKSDSLVHLFSWNSSQYKYPVSLCVYGLFNYAIGRSYYTDMDYRMISE
jgi:hypothetical protein